MSPYDKEYSIAFYFAGRRDHIELKPDRKTVQSGYGYDLITSERLSAGRPLMFTNAFAERFGPNGLPEVLTDVMFDVPNMVVNSVIKDYLSTFKIEGLQIYPVVYIDTTGQYHENLWFLNFYKQLDCWDRDNSEYSIKEEDEDAEPSIKKFSLNTEMLDSIPEESRLMFSMDGLSRGYIFVHNRIVDFLTQIKATGIRLIPVTEFVRGMETVPEGEF